MKSSIPAQPESQSLQLRQTESRDQFLHQGVIHTDHSVDSVAQRRRQVTLSQSPQVAYQQARIQMMQRSAQTQQHKARIATSTTPAAVQLAEVPIEMAPQPVQLASDERMQESAAPAPQANNTGLPNQLKAGVESLSGMSLDHVRVHYNSAQPAQLNAHAYAQGSEIHVAPGQEQHLPHEAWHVVQQAQGRVKPTVQMKGGVSVNDDAGLESEADVMGAKALAAGMALSTTAQPKYIDPAPRLTPIAAQLRYRPDLYGGGAVLQANGMAVGLLEEGTSFTVAYMQRVLASHGLTSISGALINACTYLITQQITAVASSYAAVLTPYLGILRTASSVLQTLVSIPAPVRTVFAYGVGWCLATFSTKWLGGYFTESHIHSLLTGTGDLIAGLSSLIQYLDDSINAPSTAVYRGVHGILSSIYRYFTGSTEPETSSHPSPSDTSDSTSTASESRASTGSAPMIDTKLGFMWAKVEAPELDQWSEQEQTRAGLVMNGGFGVNLFGHAMDVDGLTFRLPYGGDWSLDFQGPYKIANNVELAGVFRAGSIVASAITINRQGLQSVAVKITDISVGNKDSGPVRNGHLAMTFNRGADALNFGGGAELHVLTHQIGTEFNVGLGMDGALKQGDLKIGSKERFELLGGKLAVSNPAFAASFAPGVADISVQGDPELIIYKGIKAAGEALRFAYRSGKLEGAIQRLTVDIPINPQMAVTFELLGGRVDSAGFAADRARITFSYLSTPPESESGQEAEPALKQDDLGSLLPGFDMSWLKFGGIETLVAEGTATGITLNQEGLAAAATEKRIARFAAQLFGVRAEFDSDKGTGRISGETPEKKIGTSMNIHFPIVPAFTGTISLAASLGMRAGFEGSATKKPPKRGEQMPWQLAARANATATGNLEMGIGGALGLGPLASLQAELYAALHPSLTGEIQASGIILFDESTGSFAPSKVPTERAQGSYRLAAALSASVSARLRAQALFVFSRTLYEVRLKEWNLGEYAVTGKFFSDDSGGIELDNTEAGKPKHTFNGQSTPALPAVDHAEISSRTFLDKLKANPSTKVNDVYLMKRVLHDMFDPSAPMTDEEVPDFLRILGNAAEGPAKEVSVEPIIANIQKRKTTSTGGKEHVSHIMAPEEWIEYSTTTGVFGGVNTRKSIRPIDDLVTAYSQTDMSNLVERLRIINALLPLCDTYSGSRADMVIRLKFGIMREQEFVKSLQTG